MKKFLLFLIISSLYTAQENKQWSIELTGEHTSGIGKNFVTDGLSSFNGFGLNIDKTVYKNWGLGFRVTKQSSSVKDIAVFGDLYRPNLVTSQTYIYYRYPINQKFEIEANAAIGVFSLNSSSDYRNNNFKESGGYHSLRMKGGYALTKDNKLYITAGTELSFLRNSVVINNSYWNDYYNKAKLINFNIGIKLAL